MPPRSKHRQQKSSRTHKEESIQHELYGRLEDGLSDQHTRSAYKKELKKFASWARSEGYNRVNKITQRNVPLKEKHLTKREQQVLRRNGQPIPMLSREESAAADVIQRYTKHLVSKGYAPTTVHAYIAPVCRAFGIGMQEIDKPKRTSDAITRSRCTATDADGNRLINNQGFKESKQERFSRLVELQKVTGIRRAELSRLTGSSLTRDESGHICVEVLKGKGGKLQLQRILPEHQEKVQKIFANIAADQRVFSNKEMSNKIDLHGMRAETAREAYEYYEQRIQADPDYQKQLQVELIKRWNAMKPCADSGRTRAKYRQYVRTLYDTRPYVLRGSNRQNAIDHGRKTSYDRLAMMAVSVFHLSHWRLDVTATNYLA